MVDTKRTWKVSLVKINVVSLVRDLMDIRHLLETGALPWGLMMIPQRRKGDAEMGGLKEKILEVAKPLMLPVFTAALAVLGVSAGPLDSMSMQVTHLQDTIKSSREELVMASTRIESLERTIDRSIDDRKRQIEALDGRLRSLEIKLAEHASQYDSTNRNPK